MDTSLVNDDERATGSKEIEMCSMFDKKESLDVTDSRKLTAVTMVGIEHDAQIGHVDSEQDSTCSCAGVPDRAPELAPLFAACVKITEMERETRDRAANRIQEWFRGTQRRLLHINEPDPASELSTEGSKSLFDLQSRTVEPKSANIDKINSMAKEASIDADAVSASESEPGQEVHDWVDDEPLAGEEFIDSPLLSRTVTRSRSSDELDNLSCRSQEDSSSCSNLSSVSICYRDMPFSELQTRKKLLKTTLKEFDTVFVLRHGRLPAKPEKEPIRFLYKHYNALKSEISRREQQGPLSPPTALMSACTLSPSLDTTAREDNRGNTPCPKSCQNSIIVRPRQEASLPSLNTSLGNAPVTQFSMIRSKEQRAPTKGLSFLVSTTSGATHDTIAIQVANNVENLAPANRNTSFTINIEVKKDATSNVALSNGLDIIETNSVSTESFHSQASEPKSPVSKGKSVLEVSTAASISKNRRLFGPERINTSYAPLLSPLSSDSFHDQPRLKLPRFGRLGHLLSDASLPTIVHAKKKRSSSSFSLRRKRTFGRSTENWNRPSPEGILGATPATYRCNDDDDSDAHSQELKRRPCSFEQDSVRSDQSSECRLGAAPATSGCDIEWGQQSEHGESMSNKSGEA